jgi:DNA-binding beta-propeller fold protein YncE
MSEPLGTFRAVVLLAVTAVPIGCAGSGSTVSPSLPSLAHSTGSWVAPDVKKSDLLYVSDQGTNDVYILSYPDGRLEGTLTGFDVPVGLCVDAAGDVFVANTYGSNVIEYAHGGTTPIQTLNEPGSLPLDCAVDPKTGDLAVTNSAEGSASVSIYKDAQGEPTTIADPSMSYMDYCGYDNRGDLFADGTGSGAPAYDAERGVLDLAELRKGAAKFKNLTVLYQYFESVGGVQWDGKYVAVEDSFGDAIYQIEVTRLRTFVEGETHLYGAHVAGQFWITSSKVGSGGANVIVPNVAGESVGVWAYPAGGDATTTYTGFEIPQGVALSRAK